MLRGTVGSVAGPRISSIFANTPQPAGTCEVRELRREPDPEAGVGVLRGGARPPVQQMTHFIDQHKHKYKHKHEFGVEPIGAPAGSDGSFIGAASATCGL